MINESQAKRYCKDDISKIENYEQAINDKENIWACHHRLEFTINGEFAHTKLELIRLGTYYKRPYFELIFMKQEEHIRLHHIGNKNCVGRIMSQETRDKIRKAHKEIVHMPRSEFGKKFYEHYGITRMSNNNLYTKERNWYKNHNNKCRWENI